MRNLVPEATEGKSKKGCPNKFFNPFRIAYSEKLSNKQYK